ncbi:MAG: xanthine dehydrogenase family protein molybdopterin-binding subunit [Acidobacteria bacterium]|nr:xanthine dehydrogenase family protein molybdopterin-binding subunit [Acidobacteriota bacterium]
MKPVKSRDDEYTMFGPDGPGTGSALERRQFLKLAGGGLIVFFAVGDGLALQEGARGGGYPDDPNAYLKVGPDGRVTCFTGKIEMGQGIITSLAMMLAEELDVPLEAVDMVMGDTALCPYDAGTFGSRSTKYFGPPMRQAAAEARGVLVRLAAARLGAAEEELATKDGTVYIAKRPSKKVTYAELVGGKKIEVRLEKKPPIKPYSKHAVSGKPTLRTDARAKVTGEAKFSGDIRLPGLLYASILRPPAHGAKLKSADTAAAEKIPGARVVRDGDLVAVLHERPDVAAEALTLIEAEFEPSASKLDNTTIFAHLRNAAPRAEVVVEAGNLDEGAKLAVKTVERSYFAHYVAHAPSEPHTAVVQIEGDRATVWASTQSPFRAQGEIAQTLGIPAANVRVITPFVGCGFGGKNQGGQIVEAARLAKLAGKPVQVAWTRREEFFNDTFRPAAVYNIRSGLDAENRIVFWEYKNYHAGSRSSQPVYDIPHKRVLSFGGGFGGGGAGAVPAHPFGTGAWRGPGSNTNIFATESHIDIMAETAGLSPLEFRLKNLADARMKKVVGAAADKFGRTFAKAPTGRGYGIAITDYLGTYVATMAEVEVDKEKGAVRVVRVVCAQDTGEVINPEGARMQIEGCITMGLGYCLTEEIRFKDGRVLDENFDTYEIPRFSWLPKIEVVLVDNPDMAPQGCGEPAVTVMGAVIANAIYDAIGVRMDTLPMTPARIKSERKTD